MSDYQTRKDTIQALRIPSDMTLTVHGRRLRGKTGDYLVLAENEFQVVDAKTFEARYERKPQFSWTHVPFWGPTTITTGTFPATTLQYYTANTAGNTVAYDSYGGSALATLTETEEDDATDSEDQEDSPDSDDAA